VRQSLVINSSVSAEASVPRVLVEDAVQRLLRANPDAGVTYRDLGDGRSRISHAPPFAKTWRISRVESSGPSMFL
jgi:FMN-dependent NADH-azoreductase